MSNVLQQKKLESMAMQHVNINSHCNQALSKRWDEQKISPLPATVVLLKPGPERSDDLDRSDSDSEGKIKQSEQNISDFLEQVKERLILGMISSAVDVERPSTQTNISHFDKSMSPSEIAQRTARKEGDCAMKDAGLDQSESSKSQGSDVQTVEGSIECFFEEVKERLLLVMKGNEEKDFKGSGRQVKSYPFDGSIPKNIYQPAAKQLTGNVASKMNHFYSTSILSHSRNAQNRMPGSPKFINRDTQKLLSVASHQGISRTEEAGSRNLTCNKGEISIVSCHSASREKVNQQNGRQDTAELAATSFAQELKRKPIFDQEAVPAESILSPTNGTALRMLPMEDQQVPVGAYINRNHEIGDNRALETRKRKKHGFSLKWKASNLKDSLTFRNKLFSKKIQSAKRVVDEFGLTSSLVTLPSVSRNLSMQESSAEVPPSPASSSSDNQDVTSYNYSPVPAIDVIPYSEDVPTQEVFQEICSNQQVDVPELNKQINQAEFRGSTIVTQNADEEDDKAEGNTEAYLRDVLAAAGLLDDMDGILSMWDSPAVPIRIWVFEEVKARRDEIQDTKGIKIEHKLLFDLLNEALASKLGHFLGRRIVSPSVVIPSIEQFLNDVCGTVCKCVQSPSAGDDTINGLVDKSLKNQNQWIEVAQENVELMGRQLEKIVLKDLIEEVVFDMYTSHVTV